MYRALLATLFVLTLTGCQFDGSAPLSVKHIAVTEEDTAYEIYIDEAITFVQEPAPAEELTPVKASKARDLASPLSGQALVEIPDAEVPLAASMGSSPTLNAVYAKLLYPDCGLSEDIYYGLTDVVMNVYKGIGIWTQPHEQYNYLPGQGKISIIGGHNFYKLGQLCNASVGGVFKIQTALAQYTYRVVLASPGLWDKQANIIVDGKNTIDWTFSNAVEQVILYTCYPFDVRETDQRFIVIGELIATQPNR